MWNGSRREGLNAVSSIQVGRSAFAAYHYEHFSILLCCSTRSRHSENLTVCLHCTYSKGSPSPLQALPFTVIHLQLWQLLSLTLIQILTLEISLSCPATMSAPKLWPKLSKCSKLLRQAQARPSILLMILWADAQLTRTARQSQMPYWNRRKKQMLSSLEVLEVQNGK